MVTRHSNKSELEAKFAQYPRVALVLQGGGALGAYQAGVIEGLREVNLNPTWVAGISIGALNCAIVAGNRPEDRVSKLKEFWDTICRPPSVMSELASSMTNLFAGSLATFSDMTKNMSEQMFGSLAATKAILEGQKDFFTPRLFAPGQGNPAQISYYDTTPMISTLERLCDFDRINSGEMRVSLGATNVRNGNFVYFDNTEITLKPQHFLASGSLPPGFPATEIDGEFYWDGGCVSNTPLEHVITSRPRTDTLVFQVDLWSAHGHLPSTIDEVMTRMKDIQYSSRTRMITTAVHEVQIIKDVLLKVLAKVPAAVRAKDPLFKEVKRFTENASRFNCIHLIYQNKQTEGAYKDVEFSYETKESHWASGLDDIRSTFAHPECLDMPPTGTTFTQFDVHRESWPHTAGKQKA
jgi:NTE family protein